MSGLPIWAKYRHLNTIWEQTSAKSPSFFDLVIVQTRMRNLVLLLRLPCQSAIAFHAFSSMSFHFVGSRWSFARGLSHPGNFSVAPKEIRDANILLKIQMIFSFGLHSSWVHPKWRWSRNDVGSSMSTSFINFFHVGASFRPFWCHPHSPIKNNCCFLWANKHSQFGAISQPRSINASPKCLSHQSPASGCPYKFRSRRTTRSSMYSHDFGHLFSGIRIYIGRFRFGNFEEVLEHPPF